MEKIAIVIFFVYDITRGSHYRFAIWKRKSREILVIHQQSDRGLSFSPRFFQQNNVHNRYVEDTGAIIPSAQTPLHENYSRSFRFGPKIFYTYSYLAFENVDDVDGVE